MNCFRAIAGDLYMILKDFGPENLMNLGFKTVKLAIGLLFGQPDDKKH